MHPLGGEVTGRQWPCRHGEDERGLERVQGTSSSLALLADQIGQVRPHLLDLGFD